MGIKVSCYSLPTHAVCALPQQSCHPRFPHPRNNRKHKAAWLLCWAVSVATQPLLPDSLWTIQWCALLFTIWWRHTIV